MKLFSRKSLIAATTATALVAGSLVSPAMADEAPAAPAAQEAGKDKPAENAKPKGLLELLSSNAAPQAGQDKPAENPKDLETKNKEAKLRAETLNVWLSLANNILKFISNFFNTVTKIQLPKFF